MEKQFAVYMMASQRNGTLYIGVTSNLPKRVWEHREGVVGGFTSEYNVKTLVWYELHDDAEAAILARKAAQEMESCLEAEADRGKESRLEGLVCGYFC